MADNGFLGLGWNFPVGLDDGGQIELVPSGEEGIRQSIWTILSTSPGERVMRPDFGCGIHDLVFALNDATTAGRVVTLELPLGLHSAIDRASPRARATG